MKNVMKQGMFHGAMFALGYIMVKGVGQALIERDERRWEERLRRHEAWWNEGL